MATNLIRLVVMGDGGVGKSAITIRFMQDEFVESYDPTIEDTYAKQLLVDDIQYTVMIADTAGQESFMALRDAHIKHSDVQIVVFALDDLATFQRVRVYFEQIRRVRENLPVAVILAGSKCDVIEDGHPVVLPDEIDMLADELLS